MSLFGKSNAGLFGGLFDMNDDGELDAIEMTGEMLMLDWLLNGDKEKEEDYEDDSEVEDFFGDDDDDWDDEDGEDE